jgi:hypothetical protein
MRTPSTALSFFFVLAGCSGQINDFGSYDRADVPESGSGARGAQASGAGGSGSWGGSGVGGASGSAAPGERDVGRIGVHRLNNLEYDNTVRALLGLASTPAGTFVADEKAHGFDNIADALGMTEAQYEQYFNAADALIEATFEDGALRERILLCAQDDAACTERIVRGLGDRAYRRPLEDHEVEALTQLASDARALGEDREGAIKQVGKALLSSVPFLYRLELDKSPASSEPHALDAYELASRLSYLLWSSMPDEALFDAAASGALLEDEGLRTQLARMLEDDRSQAFIASFGGQWLGMRELEGHQVDPTVFPEWDEGLRGAMIDEGLYFFEALLREEQPVSALFTADVSYVDAALAELYGMDGVDGEEPERVVDTSDERRGFLGLASFLTLTSFSYRTAPTLRGRWVLENLLCQTIAPPPANVPELEEEANGQDPLQLNVRERLAEHRKNPTCAGCHTILDPIGLGLESFDAIGKHRTKYAGGDAIDASGTLPGGDAFNGIMELSAILAEDERLYACVSDKLMTYALSRELDESDDPYLDAIRSAWRADGASLRGLLERIVLSEPFRMRRGEGS